jgi:hypothetical protein
MANANVGDKPQIEDSGDEDDDEDLFGDEDVKKERRKLKKMMRRGQDRDDIYGSSDSVSMPRLHLDRF